MAGARAGIDVGGTFTDAALYDGSKLAVAKVRTTPADLAEGFVEALDALLDRAGLVAPGISFLVHGSTVAANALVQGSVARVGLLTTEGFRDVLEIGTQMRPRLYDLGFPKPEPLVPRELRLEARERVGPEGEVVVPLDPASVEAAAERFRAAGVEAVAVSFLFSFANPAHEQEAGRLLAERLPGIPVTLSCEVVPEYREYPRTSTTVLNACLLPLVGRYVSDLAARLGQASVAAPLHLMQSNGGLATAEAAARAPVRLVASGPAAGVIGAASLGAGASLRDLLSFDMGGTTADVGLIAGGEPELRFRGEVAGHTVNLPQIDVLSVGAGGGSIARVDRFGSLSVGPRSAGAVPGPAAYGQGGEEATVTDAHAVLGTLDPARFLGGRVPLDVRAARRVLERQVARPLRLGVEDAAAAVLEIANAAMVRALRVVSVARGHDPRRFALAAFGGAGPMHACAIAEELGMRRILVPRYPGVGSALGLLASDVRYDLSRTWVRPTGAVRRADLDRRLRGLEREARELLTGAGFRDGRALVEFQADMRYRGQAYELTVPLKPGELAAAERAFHAAHIQAYGHGSPVAETELVTLRARATGRVHPSRRRGSVDGTATGRDGRRPARPEACATACTSGTRFPPPSAGPRSSSRRTPPSWSPPAGSFGTAWRNCRPRAMTKLDPITQEILGHAFAGVAEEMAVVEYRSSFSPIIREMLDFSCGIFDAEGRMVAHSEQIPAQLGLMQFALQESLARHGRLAPGDVVLCNHPYHGGTHTPDLQVFAPAYHDGTLLGYAGSIAHHIDIGERVAGTESAENTEIFQEGLLLPPVKLVERGRENRALYELIAANVRDPESTLGDLAAQLAACRRGVERLRELCRRHSTATVLTAGVGLLEQTSRRTRAEFSSWPARRVSCEGFLDDDGIAAGKPVRLSAAVQVKNGALHIDLAGTAEQSPGGLNVPWASTHAGAYFAVRCFVPEGIPQNDGLTRHVVVSAPEGTILRPRFPAAVSARHLTVQRLADVLCRALGELLPERAAAASHVSFPTFVFQARDPRRGLTIFTDILGGGGGARPDAPGDNAIDTYTSNCALLPAEIAEMEYPWRVERTELVEGSGGAGRQPGGLGFRRDYRLLAEAGEGMYYVEQLNPAFGAAGWNGGGRGAPARILLRRDGESEWSELPAGKGYLHLRCGDTVSFVSAGGGGYGRARRRRSSSGATGAG